MVYLGGIFVIVIGLIMALAPAAWWEITESWKSNGTEASDSYLRHTRIGGVVFTVLGVACMLVLLFLD